MSVFRFKQFSVDQTGCAMKINTDGVLLGALAGAEQPRNILDIGTGTGVIALMLAQRFPSAQIDAVEIDDSAAETAARNFKNAIFSDRLTIFPTGFEQFLNYHPEKKYDLIVSNPPFYINSLTSPKKDKNLAKHADADFFETLVRLSAQHLTKNGSCCLVLPVETAKLVKNEAIEYGLFMQTQIEVCSFSKDAPHREIISFGFEEISPQIINLTIYDGVNIYSEAYQQLLQPYFIIF